MDVVNNTTLDGLKCVNTSWYRLLKQPTRLRGSFVFRRWPS